jgi:KDO2-lipid IV(A) lauroyltransferase
VNLKYRFVKSFVSLIARLPISILYLIASILAFKAQYIFRYRRKVIQDNLKNSFPNYTSKQLKQIENQFYKRFTITIVETLMQFRLDKNFLKGRLILSNPELLKKYHDEKRNIVAISGHYCNWEWLGTSLGMLSPYDALAIYKPLSNKIVDELMIEVRTINGTKLIPVKKATKTILSYSKPSISLFIADQAANPTHSYWTKFLNQETTVFWGAEKIAKASNAIVVFLAMRLLKNGYYSLEVIELCNNSSLLEEGAITQLHVSALEKEIIAAPEFWLWSHKRWKHKRAQ